MRSGKKPGLANGRAARIIVSAVPAWARRSLSMELELALDEPEFGRRDESLVGDADAV